MSLTPQQQKLAVAFPEVSWAIDNRLCIFRPTDSLTPAKAARMVAWMKEFETDSEHPFHRFTDFTRLRAIEVSLQDVKNTAYWRRTNYTGPLVKSAFLAETDDTFIIADAYRFFMAGSQIMVRVFQNLHDAATWLGVPEEVLAASTNG